MAHNGNLDSSSGSLPYVTVMVMLPSSFVYVGAVSAAGAAGAVVAPGAAVAGAAAFLVNLTSVSFVSPGLAYLTFPLAIAM